MAGAAGPADEGDPVTITREHYRNLRDDLADALEGLLECLPYVPDYFREKHDLEDYVADAQDALAEADALLGTQRAVDQ